MAGKHPAQDHSACLQNPNISENGQRVEILDKISSTDDDVSVPEPDAELDILHDTQRYAEFKYISLILPGN